MKHLVAPSILSANFAWLGKDIEMLNESQADWIHVDVMDGRFVPNISFGLSVLKDISPIAKKFLDVHLMIVEPQNFIHDFHKAGAQNLSIHIEACTHLHSAIQIIKSTGMTAGVAINPHTPVSALEDIIKDIDMVCLMSVNPGFGGQKFIPRTLDKIRKLKNLIQQEGSKALIEVDGGVDANNAETILRAGADIIVAGNAVFKAPDPKGMIAQLKNIQVNTITV
jgi:ribulose-phosphate 3-epimerase